MDLEEIFRAHQKEIYVYFLRNTGDRHRAEDMAQDTMVRAWEGLVSFRHEASFRTWLFTVARNVLADSFRARRRELLEDPPEGSWQPDSDTRLGIEETMAALPAASREAIVLCDVLQFSPTEAANVVGIDANAFRVRLHRARERFRRLHADD